MSCTGISQCYFWKPLNKTQVNYKMYILHKAENKLSTPRMSIQQFSPQCLNTDQNTVQIKASEVCKVREAGIFAAASDRVQHAQS